MTASEEPSSAVRHARFRRWLARRETIEFIALVRLLTGIEMLPQHVEKNSYEPLPGQPLKTQGDKISPETLGLAHTLFADSNARLAGVAGKVATLLTVMGIAASGTLTSLSLIGLPSAPVFYVLFVGTALVFLGTGWFLFKFLGVGLHASPQLDQEFLDLSDGEKKATLVCDLITATSHNNRRNDFLVDVYRAGRRLCACSLACSLGLITFAVLSHVGQEERIITKLRADPDLLKQLRGPEGVAGAPGAAGKNGIPGQPGATGGRYLPAPDAHWFEPDPAAFHFDPRHLVPVLPPVERPGTRP